MCLNGELEIVRVSLRLRIIGQNDGEEGEAVKLPGYVEFLNPRSQSSFFRNLSILISFLTRYIQIYTLLSCVYSCSSINLRIILLIFINLKLFSFSENNRKMKNTMVDVNIKFGEEGREE